MNKKETEKVITKPVKKTNFLDWLFIKYNHVISLEFPRATFDYNMKKYYKKSAPNADFLLLFVNKHTFSNLFLVI